MSVLRYLQNYRPKRRKGKNADPALSFYRKHKFLIQIGGMAGFVLIFGIISVLAGIPKEIFYTVSGLIVGFINGISAAIMYND